MIEAILTILLFMIFPLPAIGYLVGGSIGCVVGFALMMID